MDEHKKRILILIGVIIVFISLLAILFSLLSNNEDNNKNKPSTNPGVNEAISKEIVLLDDESQFFGIQKVINDFYFILFNQNTDDLLKLLDSSFKKEKSIDDTNIYSIINPDYENPSFVAKEIYYNPNSSITYYFVNGYLIDIKMSQEDYYYEASVNYLIIKDSNNNYTIRPLDNNSNILNIAKNYSIVNKNIDNGKSLTFNTFSEENKLSIYINEFMNLLIYDNKRAYDLLDDSTKNKYDGYNDFNNQTLDIYNMLTSKIFSFAKKEENGSVVYNIEDNNQNKIIIYEKNIMDYKIGF